MVLALLVVMLVLVVGRGVDSHYRMCCTLTPTSLPGLGALQAPFSSSMPSAVPLFVSLTRNQVATNSIAVLVPVVLPVRLKLPLENNTGTGAACVLREHFSLVELVSC